MELLFTIRVALRAIMRNKLRSLLTVLGVVIGVCAVITMVNIGSGAQISIENAISGLGTNMLIIFPGSMTKGGMRTGFGTVTTLINEDAQAIRDECPTVQLVSPIVNTAAQVVYQNQNWGTSIMGTDPEFQRIKNWPLARGEFFTIQDVKASTKVCVLGKTVAEKLYGTQNPVGQIVRVKRIPFRVIGLLTEKGQTTFGQDQDDTVVIPYTTAQKRLMGITYLSMIMASAVSNERIPDAQKQITTLLRQRHHIPKGEDDDFTVRNLADLTATFTIITGILTLLLGSIASISLLVGGIGIMNIMLVSVTERTREIGIRMSVGAKPNDILLQFLLEAVLLSLIGGGVGIVLGIGLTAIIAYIAEWPTPISFVAILVSSLFAASVGIFFGLYPARKASRMNPIEALRYE
jgi:putative ABC transport system permease protein